jgi:AraC family transcriptional regulator, positive regulator of tynA and feaB
VKCRVREIGFRYLLLCPGLAAVLTTTRPITDTRENLVNPGNVFALLPALEYEHWRELIRPDWGTYTPEQPNKFVGRIRSRELCGFRLSELGDNVGSTRSICWRTHRDVQRDGVDHFYAVFQLSGSSAILHKENVVELGTGRAALIDSAQAAQHIHEEGSWQWLGLHLPRQRLISHLGFEPQSGLLGQRFSQLLLQILLDAVADEQIMTARARDYIQMAVYDLIGALVVDPCPAGGSTYHDRMFRSVCAIIQKRFRDPELEPNSIAHELGVSPRSLQRLFQSRGTTCTRYLQSLRLDHALLVLRQQASHKASRPLAQIAYASGYDDYNQFLRQFRRAFGESPSRLVTAIRRFEIDQRRDP